MYWLAIRLPVQIACPWTRLQISCCSNEAAQLLSGLLRQHLLVRLCFRLKKSYCSFWGEKKQVSNTNTNSGLWVGWRTHPTSGECSWWTKAEYKGNWRTLLALIPLFFKAWTQALVFSVQPGCIFNKYSTVRDTPDLFGPENVLPCEMLLSCFLPQMKAQFSPSIFSLITPQLSFFLVLVWLWTHRLMHNLYLPHTACRHTLQPQSRNLMPLLTDPRTQQHTHKQTRYHAPVLDPELLKFNTIG